MNRLMKTVTLSKDRKMPVMEVPLVSVRGEAVIEVHQTITQELTESEGIQ